MRRVDVMLLGVRDSSPVPRSALGVNISGKDSCKSSQRPLSPSKVYNLSNNINGNNKSSVKSNNYSNNYSSNVSNSNKNSDAPISKQLGKEKENLCGGNKSCTGSLPKMRTMRQAIAAYVKATSSACDNGTNGNLASSMSDKEKGESSCGEKLLPLRWDFSSSPPDRDMLNIETEINKATVSATSPRPPSNPTVAEKDKRNTHSASRLAENKLRSRVVSPNTSGPIVVSRCSFEDYHNLTCMKSDSEKSKNSNLPDKRWNMMTKLVDDEDRMKPDPANKSGSLVGREAFYEQFASAVPLLADNRHAPGLVVKERSLSSITGNYR